MGILREFFMWAVFHEYREAVKSKADDMVFFERVYRILEQLQDEAA